MPDGVQINGPVHCTTGGCGYDPSSNAVFWQGTFSPGDSVVIDFEVTIFTDVPCGTDIVNHAQAGDGLALLDFTATTHVAC